jgi:hypothetical protein
VPWEPTVTQCWPGEIENVAVWLARVVFVDVFTTFTLTVYVPAHAAAGVVSEIVSLRSTPGLRFIWSDPTKVGIFPTTQLPGFATDTVTFTGCVTLEPWVV